MSELIAAALGFAWGFWIAYGMHAKARRLARNHQPTRTP